MTHEKSELEEGKTSTRPRREKYFLRRKFEFFTTLRIKIMCVNFSHLIIFVFSEY